MERGSQIQWEAMIGGEPVGGELGPAADRSVRHRTEHRCQPDEGQHSADHPPALVQCPGHGNGQSDDHGAIRVPFRLWRPARMLARSVSRLVATRQGAASHDTSSIGRVAPEA